MTDEIDEIMSNRYFREIDGLMEPCTVLEWGEWLETADRKIRRSKFKHCEISSVSLGLNHAWRGKPLLYETMIFGDLFSEAQWRFTTREQITRFHLLLESFISDLDRLLAKRSSWRRVKQYLERNDIYKGYLDCCYEHELKRLCYKTAADKL